MGRGPPALNCSRRVRHPDQLLGEDAVLVRELREVVGRLGVCEEDVAAPVQRAAGGGGQRRQRAAAAGGVGRRQRRAGGQARAHPKRR